MTLILILEKKILANKEVKIIQSQDSIKDLLLTNLLSNQI